MAGRILRSGEGPVSNWNVANLVTFARVAASPVFFLLMMSELSANGRWLAAVVFVAIIASDAIDGALARGRNLSTPLGVLLDPIADKLVITAALIALSFHGELPWWVTVVILVRELGITVYRMVIVSKEIHAASWAGKLKTVTQSVAITLAIAPFSEVVGFVAYDINAVVMTAAVVLTVASGADYVIKAWRAMTWDAPRVAALEASLLAAGMTVATCESLTGGLVISALVEPAGASAVVRGSIVAYATDVKSSLVGVDSALLASQGAVNAEVATQMARGARELLGASIGVATTGVAGPDVQDGAPVGTVFVAVSTLQGERCEGAHFVGDRDDIRRAACDLALELIANSVPRE